MRFDSSLKLVNRLVGVGPVVRLAARFVGSGPNRLKMVRLSHELRHNRVSTNTDGEHGDPMRS